MKVTNITKYIKNLSKKIRISSGDQRLQITRKAREAKYRTRFIAKASY